MEHWGSPISMVPLHEHLIFNLDASPSLHSEIVYWENVGKEEKKLSNPKAGWEVFWAEVEGLGWRVGLISGCPGILFWLYPS